MSGLKKKQRDITYLGVRKGQLTLRVSEPTETSESRTIGDGDKARKIHEEIFDCIEDAYIVGIYKRESDVPFQSDKLITWEVLMKTKEGDLYQVTLPYSSRYAQGFFTRIESVDFSKPVDMNLYNIKGDDGKSRAYLTLSQGGEKIPSNYTKDNPNGMPELKQFVLKNKTVWDDSEQLKFFEAIMEDAVKKIEEATGKAKPFNKFEDNENEETSTEQSEPPQDSKKVF